MTTKNLNKIGFICALTTFLIATYIITAFYLGEVNIIGNGLLFIPIAFVINLIVLILLHLSAKRKQIETPTLSINIMLSNIPIGIVYICFAFFLMSYFRVTINNDTRDSIFNIKLYGCDNKTISKLEPGESETIWIHLENDCSLNINYSIEKKIIKKDIIAGYLCSGMGQPETYNISGKNNPKY